MTRYLIGNWKCYPDGPKTALHILREIEKRVVVKPEAQIIICPPSVFLSELAKKTKKVKLGGQDAFWEQEGPFTGQVSPLMISQAGAEYCLVGHSETRSFKKLSLRRLRDTIISCLEVGITPVFCFGEKHRRHDWKSSLLHELDTVLKGKIIEKTLLAYEPVWAIGRERPASFLETKPVLEMIQDTFGKAVPVLYGGSILEEEQVLEYLEAGFAGLLVGRASLDPETFSSLYSMF